MYIRIWIFGVLTVVALVVVTLFGGSIVKQDAAVDSQSPPLSASIQNDGREVGVHGTIANPAEIDGRRAEEIYQSILRNLVTEYGQAGDPITSQYPEWKRYNKVPYHSARHGQHFVNNYANELAVGYGKYERVGSFPVGAMVVKDSFTVSDQGTILSGPLFLMEKMPAGFAPANGDWRYMMIEPSGKITGLSEGVRSANVKFCATCHNTVPVASDRMFFMPQAVRVK